MKLFLTVGTQLPFDRLTRAVDEWFEETAIHGVEIFAQIGPMVSSTYQPRNFPWVEFLPPDAFSTRFSQATHIIAHAGMGTIISTLVAGKSLTVLPRRAALGEQRNDHQLATVLNFSGKPGIFAAEHEADLAAAIDAMLGATSEGQQKRAKAFADPSLTDAIRAEIMA